MTDREQELAALRAKQAASERMGSGFTDRIAAIKARIAELEAQR